MTCEHLNLDVLDLNSEILALGNIANVPNAEKYKNNKSDIIEKKKETFLL